ncbi:helix-turn-helix domain-containing protein [Bifidobacterium pseudolongum]|uniref:HTH cro/C1-type domain-containing protein n=1 Tax=Bifidobacterium pseudolongum subsp. globosum TaxID=1690 RepID=A0A2N3QVM2_9BIFI|nr:helix-turn-helix transcriptional regulator [Bifidobacterium pseudolongum]PKU96182.1 hypothetical protein CQR45_0304 [Bifidobacterium pseudolongum subsp. globosum]
MKIAASEMAVVQQVGTEMSGELAKKRLTKTAVGKQLGVGRMTINRWVTTGNMSLKNFIALAKVAGVDPSAILAAAIEASDKRETEK